MSVRQGVVRQVNVSPQGGVPKRPVFAGRVEPLGILGDAVAHPKYHGGPLQALLIITVEAIEEARTAGFPLFAGALGENLTIEGLHHRELRVGDHLRAGTALLQITKPRQPCKTLDPYGKGIQTWLWDATVKQGNTASPRWGRSGFYVKVLEPGDVQPGDAISVVAAE